MQFYKTCLLLVVCLCIALNFHSSSHGLLVAAEESAAAETPVAADPGPEGVLMEGLSADDEKVIDASKESFVFQAEVNRLMDIIINSLCKFLLFASS